MPTLSPDFVSSLIESAILLVAVMAVRTALGFALRHGDKKSDALRRRLRAIIQNAATLIMLMGLAFIWSPQLSALALSLTAFAVALVFALKEFLMCMVGAVYRTAARPFDIGDWVEVEHLRGEVVDEGLFAFRVRVLDGGGGHEAGGDVAIVPNAKLLTAPLVNKTYQKSFIRHAFDVVLRDTARVAQARIAAETAVRAEAAAHGDLARRYYSSVARRLSIEVPSTDPTVALRTTDTGLARLHVTLVCPPAASGPAETTITDAILKAAYAAPSPEASPELSPESSPKAKPCGVSAVRTADARDIPD